MAEPKTLAEISQMLARPMTEMPEAAARLLREQPVCAQIRFGKKGVQIAPLGTPWDSQAPWIDVATGYDTLPVPVLEHLAGAWEVQAAKMERENELDLSSAFADCARMLREAIAKGSAG